MEINKIRIGDGARVSLTRLVTGSDCIFGEDRDGVCQQQPSLIPLKAELEKLTFGMIVGGLFADPSTKMKIYKILKMLLNK